MNKIQQLAANVTARLDETAGELKLQKENYMTANTRFKEGRETFLSMEETQIDGDLAAALSAETQESNSGSSAVNNAYNQAINNPDAIINSFDELAADLTTKGTEISNAVAAKEASNLAERDAFAADFGVMGDYVAAVDAAYTPVYVEAAASGSTVAKGGAIPAGGIPAGGPSGMMPPAAPGGAK